MKKASYRVPRSVVYGLALILVSCHSNTTPTNSDPASGTKAQVLYSSEDGIVSAWASGATATQVARSASDKAVYKSLAIAPLGGTSYLYVTDIYDTGFHHQQGAPFQGASFVDRGSPAIPADFGPFGIANINGLLYVTYAKHKVGNHDDSAGVGNGYIDVFNPDGSFVKRFASNGSLNSPWGVTMSGGGFGEFSNDILVNNFGDGTVSVFGLDGTFLGQLKDPNGTTVTIDGLWSVKFPDPAITTALDPNTLYWAAGPQDEGHGMFGYIKPSGSGYMVTKLVADTAGFGAARIDPNLVNGWGIAITSSGTLWVS